MKIALVTLFTPDIQSYALPSLENRRRYCRKHGYTLVHREDKLDDRAPQWSKIPLLMEELRNFDWVFWSDIDALVMNHEKPITDFIDERFDLIISGRPPKPKISTGEFVIRNCPWSSEFLTRVNSGNPTHYWHEQQAMISLYEKDIRVRERMTILPFGSFSKRINTYVKGDFIIHFPAMSTTDRTRLVGEYLQHESGGGL